MSSNPLPGNPYAGPSPKGDARTQATFALAFEKRTENLILWRDRLLNLGNEIQAAEVGGIINERIGLNRGNDE